MILYMISVNQGIGTSVPEKIEKWRCMMFLIKGEEPLNGGGVEIFKGVIYLIFDTMGDTMYICYTGFELVICESQFKD